MILPFEEPLLRAHGIEATFVGHPLLDRATRMPGRDEARAALGVAPNERLLALFPGSRQQEIARHFDDFVATARLVSSMVLRLRVVVSVAPSVQIDPQRCPFPMVHHGSLGVLRADPATAKIPVIAVTASVMQQDRKLITEAGFDAYIGKPINLKEFLVTVRKWLGEAP